MPLILSAESVGDFQGFLSILNADRENITDSFRLDTEIYNK
jgi:hypothetical protein